MVPTPRSSGAHGLLFRLALLALLLFSTALAQTTSSPANASSSATGGARVVTTAIPTTLFPSGTTGSPVPTSLVLTITLAPANTTAAPNRTATAVPSGATPTTIVASSGNETAYAFSNGTILFNNGTRLYPNGTEVAANGTVLIAGTQPYNGSIALGLPFHIALDPAYGIGGAVLIISGGFVGVLGGKNRWSSMAIVTGYVLLLFTLVMILSLGVEPALAPPSPAPPSTLTRGLYALACIIAAILGSAIGIFFWRYAKYLVCGAGGFAVGWFVLALHTGGVASGNIIARWGIIGGLFVVTFVAGLWDAFHVHLVILATSWIGATAVVLGIDCFARTGFKEFYIYDLGYSPLFPSLNGYGFPLLVNMQIFLGVLAALFLIFAAIQYRVLGILQTKLKQIQKEDRERKEAEDERKNAERFKELGRDLEKWEGKHGTSGGSRSPLDRGSDATIPVLDQYGRTGSQLSLDTKSNGRFGSAHEYGSLPLESPMSAGADRQSGEVKSLSGQSVGMLPVMQLGEPVASELPAENIDEVTDPELREKMQILAEIQKVKQSIETMRAIPPERLSPVSTGGNARASRVSFGPMNPPLRPSPSLPAQQNPQDADWQDYLQSRTLYTPPGGVSPPISASLPVASGRLNRISPAVMDAVSRRERTMSAFELGGARESGSSPGEFGEYERTADHRRYSSNAPLATTTNRTANPSPRSPDVIGHAPLQPATSRRTSMPPRTVTYEELTARHNAKIKQLQQPVTETLKSEVELQQAKADYERRREMERRSVQSKPTDSKRAGDARRPSGLPADGLHRIPTEDPLVKAAKWRQSLGADGGASPRTAAPTVSPVKDNSRTVRPSLDSQGKRVSRGPHQFIN